MVFTELLNNYDVAEQHLHTQGTDMKTILNTIYEILESMGRAKAAAHLSRQGLHQEAKDLMLRD